MDKFILDGMWMMLTGAPLYDPDNEGQENIEDSVADEEARDEQTTEFLDFSWLVSLWIVQSTCTGKLPIPNV